MILYRHDCTDYHQNTIECPRILNPRDFKHFIQQLNGNDYPQLNASDYSNSVTFLTFSDDIQKQRLHETKQPPFRLTKLYTFHYGSFAWISNSHLVLNSTLKEKVVCCDRYGYIIENDSWSLIVRELELTYDDEDNKLIYHGNTLTSLHDDGFCKPTIQTPITSFWFPEALCLIISINSFIGGMSKLNNRYWLETEHFLTMKNLIFHMKLLAMTLNVNPDSLVLKSSPEVNYFAINPQLFILLKILTSLSDIKKDSNCKLVNATLFNSPRMNNLPSSQPNSFLVSSYILKIN